MSEKARSTAFTIARLLPLLEVKKIDVYKVIEILEANGWVYAPTKNPYRAMQFFTDPELWKLIDALRPLQDAGDELATALDDCACDELQDRHVYGRCKEHSDD